MSYALKNFWFWQNRPYVRPSLHLSCGEIFLFKHPARFGGKSHGHPDFKREKNNNKAESFFRPSLKIYVNLENRERARTGNKKQRILSSFEEKHQNFIIIRGTFCILSNFSSFPAILRYQSGL